MNAGDIFVRFDSMIRDLIRLFLLRVRTRIFLHEQLQFTVV